MGERVHSDDNGNVRVYHAGSHVFREGEPGEEAFVIEQGRIGITALAEGEEVELATLGKGDLFGEVALIDDQMRTATATALEDTRVLVISREYFHDRLEAADPILHVFLRVILERFRDTQAVRLRGESLQPRDERVSDYDFDRRLAVERLQRESELEAAIENGDLRLHYQPILDLETLRPTGFEALVRWQHPERGLIPPGDFISFAELTGLIVPMGLWMVREAPLVLRRFQALFPGDEPLYISVNVSGRQLETSDEVDALVAALTSSGIELTRVNLEITESVLMRDPQRAAAALEGLRAVGVRVTVDDFGTGYSSLGYLHRFPIDMLKIDRSFVDSMLRFDSSAKIVRAIASLARDLDLEMVAEGIETPEQLRALRKIGVGHGQGFFFARPAPPDAIADWLAEDK